MYLNINTDAVVKYTAKLEKLHRSRLPLAIRQTLNNAAFDVKKNTMPKQAKKIFVGRDKNFFKAKSSVGMAKGWNIKTMTSTVGFKEGNKKNRAVRELEEQEHGGNLGGKSFIPLDTARVNKSNRKKIRKANLYDKKLKFLEAKKSKGKTYKQRFIKTAFKVGVNGFVLSERINSEGGSTLWKIQKLSTTKKLKLKSVGIFTVKKNKVVKIKKTNFMRTSSLQSAKNLERWYIQNANKQIKKL